MTRIRIAAVGLALFVVACGVGARAQSAATAAGSAAALVTTTAHPPVPDHPSRYWLVPDPPPRAAAGSGAAQLSRGARLVASGRFAEGLPLVSSARLNPSTPLAAYGRFYTGVALLGLGRAEEADAAFAAIGPRVEGYLQEALPLRMAESALARQQPQRAVAILDQAIRDRRTARDEMLLLLGMALETAGERDRAIETYERLYYEFPLSAKAADAQAALIRIRPTQPAVTPARVSRELARAEQLFTARRWSDARAGFAIVASAATGADRDLAGLRMAECDHYLKQNRAAIAALKPFLRPGPLQAEARFVHLTATRALGDRTTYVSLVRALVDDHPDTRWAEEALNALATHYSGDDDAEADRVFRELARRFPRGRFADRAAWKIGWQAYKRGQFGQAAATFEAAAAAFPRADYRPSWLYWAARARDQVGQQPAAIVLYRVVASDYLNSYYGRLASRVLASRREAPVRPLVVTERVSPSSATLALVPNEPVIRALAGAELYDEALRETEYARQAWGDSPVLQATVAWIRHQRALGADAGDRFADLRGAITMMRRAYPQFMAAGGEQLPPDILRVIFPLDYWPLIKKYSDAHGFDPFLMTALIAQESTFTPDVRSSANAVGLMQLIPPTARRYASKLGLRYSAAMLTQPETNVRLGMRYFKDLMDRFGGAHFALASYNAGEGRISRWITERQGFAQDEFIDDIPFSETQNYVKRILGTADDYRRLYGDRVTASAVAVAE